MIKNDTNPDRYLTIQSNEQSKNKLVANIDVVVKTEGAVVISLKEYDRLKEIENKYNEEHSSDSTMRMQIDLDGIHVTYDKNIILNVFSKSEEETK